MKIAVRLSHCLHIDYFDYRFGPIDVDDDGNDNHCRENGTANPHRTFNLMPGPASRAHNLLVLQQMPNCH
jgi:hypothetical protein